MTDRLQLDSFDQFLSAEFERYVAGVRDPKTATEIAAGAMRPRGTAASLRRSRNAKRLLLLGIAAVLLVPAAYLGAQRLLPKPDNSVLPVPSLLAVATPRPTVAATNAPPVYLHNAIVLRAASDPDTGVDVYEVRPDGQERFLRNIPDSIFESGHVATDLGTVRDDGWLALADQQKPWPMALIDLADETNAPFIVNDASLGGISPVWGPTGLIAADGHITPGDPTITDRLVFADPVARTSRTQGIRGGLVGGGPSIVWTADGGILSEVLAGASSTFSTVHLDGSPDTPGFPELYEPGHVYGPGNTSLELCLTLFQCPASPLGSVRLVQPDGSNAIVYTPGPGFRVLASQFGVQDGEYWVLVSYRNQLQVINLDPSGDRVVATIDRASDWQGVYMRDISREEDLISLAIDRGGLFDIELIDSNTGISTFHSGALAGYVTSSALADTSPASAFQPGIEPAPPSGGAPVTLPSTDEMIAAEKEMNPGRIVAGTASRDATPGDAEMHDYTFNALKAGGPFDFYFDCIGSAPATLKVHGMTIENPCLQAGSYIDMTNLAHGEQITVHASGDTTWRVEIYDTYQPVGPGDTPAPVAEPAS